MGKIKIGVFLFCFFKGGGGGVCCSSSKCVYSTVLSKKDKLFPYFETLKSFILSTMSIKGSANRRSDVFWGEIAQYLCLGCYWNRTSEIQWDEQLDRITGGIIELIASNGYSDGNGSHILVGLKAKIAGIWFCSPKTVVGFSYQLDGSYMLSVCFSMPLINNMCC